MLILNEVQTIKKLAENKNLSISRYGDGELKLCKGKKSISQIADPGLQKRLVEILQSEESNCLVAIPNIYSGIHCRPDTKAYGFWDSVAKNIQYKKLYRKDKVYGSSFITRTDNAYSNNTEEYWDSMKALWAGRKCAAVYGDGKRFFNIEEHLFKDANILFDVLVERRDAWSNYQKTLQRCLDIDKDCLFLIGAGAMATVLAYDLSMHGRVAYDIGHAGMLYGRFVSEDKNVTE